MSYSKIQVDGKSITIKSINQADYLSLTDIAKKKSNQRPGEVIRNWLRNAGTIGYLEAWEKLNSPNFNDGRMTAFKSEVITNRAGIISVQQYLEMTGAIGLSVIRGRYGGVFGAREIALNFAGWIEPVFQLYITTEFERLKTKENEHWKTERLLSKRNYALQTEAVRLHLLPQSTEPPEKDWISFANEADLLNMSVFGTTAKIWRHTNPKAKGNIRDHANTIQLLVLSNLEAINAELIKEGLSKDERYQRLKEAALFQLGIFYRDQKKLE